MSTLSTNNIVIQYDIKTESLESVKNSLKGVSESEKKVLDDLIKMKKGFQDTGTEANKNLKSIDNNVNDLKSNVRSFGATIAAAFSLGAITAFGREVFNITAKMEGAQKAIEFASKSMTVSQQNMKMLTDLAQKYGVQITDLTDAYKKFYASGIFANQSTKETNRQFNALLQATSTLRLSQEETNGVMLAWSQILSKGKLSAEEVRGQIGERLPGAFGLFADALGMTTSQLSKALEQGEVLAGDSLPKVATALTKTFGDGATTLDGMTQRAGRLINEFDKLKTKIGEVFFGVDGAGGNFGRGLTLILEKLNLIFESEKSKNLEEKLKTIEQITKDWGRASDNALQNQINKQGQIIRQLEAQGMRYKQEAEKKKALGLLTEEDLEAHENLAKVIFDELQHQNNIRIALVQIKKEKQKSNETDKKTEKQLRAEYDARMRLYELEKQQQILMAQIRNEKLGEVGAEKLYQERVYQLKKEYADKKIGIDQKEVDVAQLKFKKAEKDYDDHANQLLMTNKEANVEIQNTDKETQDKRDKQLKDWVKAYKAALKETTKAEKDAAAEKAEIIQSAANFGMTLLNLSMNLRAANANNELALLQRNSEEEIRLAGDNAQKVAQIREQQAQKEREIKARQFEAQRVAAVAQVVFETASMIAKWTSNPVTVPLAALAIAAQAAQIGFILAQPTPEFEKGTQGRPHKGRAIVGEKGSELIIGAETGKVYLSPNKASLVDFKEKSHVIPAKLTERFLAGKLESSQTSTADRSVLTKLDSINSTLSRLPITQLTMDQRGFGKYIRTETSRNQVLNNRFASKRK